MVPLCVVVVRIIGQGVKFRVEAGLTGTPTEPKSVWVATPRPESRMRQLIVVNWSCLCSKVPYLLHCKSAGRKFHPSLNWLFHKS